MNKLEMWIRNALMFHQRIMVRYLRKRDWVVFYLPERSRICDSECCWLSLYKNEMGQSSAASIRRTVRDKTNDLCKDCGKANYLIVQTGNEGYMVCPLCGGCPDDDVKY